MSYTVPEFLLKQSPEWSDPFHSFSSFGRTIELPEVDEDIGHTLVHYLYDGTYQTLKPQGAAGPPDSTVEYRRGILAYCTARLYKLNGLVDHAISSIELFGKDLSIFQILEYHRRYVSQTPQGRSLVPEAPQDAAQSCL